METLNVFSRNQQEKDTMTSRMLISFTFSHHQSFTLPLPPQVTFIHLSALLFASPFYCVFNVSYFIQHIRFIQYKEY